MKIKDNVDLKVLENYGFESMPNNPCVSYCKTIQIPDMEDLNTAIYVMSDRTLNIDIYSNIDFGNIDCISGAEYTLSTIYDLIQAGLVEKVGKC